MFGGLDFNILTRNIYVVVGFVINLAEVSVPIVTSQRDSLKHTFLCNGWYHTEISSKHEVLAMEDAKGKKGVGGGGVDNFIRQSHCFFLSKAIRRAGAPMNIPFCAQQSRHIRVVEQSSNVKRKRKKKTTSSK